MKIISKEKDSVVVLFNDNTYRRTEYENETFTWFDSRGYSFDDSFDFVLESAYKAIKLRTSLEHATKRSKQFSDDYKGRTQELTFHAGYDLGYWKGRESALKDIIYDLTK